MGAVGCGSYEQDELLNTNKLLLGKESRMGGSSGHCGAQVTVRFTIDGSSLRCHLPLPPRHNVCGHIASNSPLLAGAALILHCPLLIIATSRRVEHTRHHTPITRTPVLHCRALACPIELLHLIPYRTTC